MRTHQFISIMNDTMKSNLFEIVNFMSLCLPVYYNTPSWRSARGLSATYSTDTPQRVYVTSTVLTAPASETCSLYFVPLGEVRITPLAVLTPTAKSFAKTFLSNVVAAPTLAE